MWRSRGVDWDKDLRQGRRQELEADREDREAGTRNWGAWGLELAAEVETRSQ